MHPLNRHSIVILCAVVLALSWTGIGRADTQETFSGSGTDTTGSGQAVSASAVFTLSGTTLKVLLTNTATNPTSDISNVLSAVAFNVNSSSTLTPMSAALPTGSFVVEPSVFGSFGPGGVGDGWGYGTGLGNKADGFNSVITATGAFNGVGHSNFSANSNALSGIGYGIFTNSSDYTQANKSTGGNGLVNNGPFEQNSVLFTFTVSSNFSLSQLGSSVAFQYGTASNETKFSGSAHGGVTTLAAIAPEPSSMVIAAVGTIGFVGYGMRRRRLKK
jgi:hypothetical protein